MVGHHDDFFEQYGRLGPEKSRNPARRKAPLSLTSTAEGKGHGGAPRVTRVAGTSAGHLAPEEPAVPALSRTDAVREGEFSFYAGRQLVGATAGRDVKSAGRVERGASKYAAEGAV